ncbi:transmembrane protein 25 [Ambystoma mexicanum]|uniref:transmembrane protein 25 n=1 Tax=Ambystoma mexicanum TaxID=8296 RepID=UPI0037E9212B
MNRPGRGCRASISQALLVLHLKALLQSGMGEPEPQIDGRSSSVSTLQENESRDFTCQAEGWQSVPLLTWYLNGEKQEVNSSTVVSTSAEQFEQSSSTFTVTARKSHRELNCTVTDPVSGQTGNASVLLNVQFKPEIVQMDAKYRESRDPGLFVVLFVLVQANPPANITWVDQDGHIMVNTSNFLVMDIKSYPWLTNHTVQVQLRSLANNYSFSATNDVGITNSSIATPGLLQSNVEVPVLWLIIGGSLVTLVFLLLSISILCLLFKKRKKQLGVFRAVLPPSDSNNLKLTNVRLPRDNMSLPSNLQLNNLSQGGKGKPGDARIEMNLNEEEEVSEQDSSEIYAPRGFGRFPTVGYIYKVSSMSSDEIWL